MIPVTFYHAGTGEEITDLGFGALEVVPAVGENIHWWEDKLGETGLRRDFTVTAVRHDLRIIFIPGARREVSSPHHSVEIFLLELVAFQKLRSSRTETDNEL